MLETVKTLYANGNAYELLFASLAIGAALFITAFGIISQIRFKRASDAMLFVSFIPFISIAISLFMLRGNRFAIPRTVKIYLLAELYISLVMLWMIL
jgi:hypothetical protein